MFWSAFHLWICRSPNQPPKDLHRHSLQVSGLASLQHRLISCSLPNPNKSGSASNGDLMLSGLRLMMAARTFAMVDTHLGSSLLFIMSKSKGKFFHFGPPKMASLKAGTRRKGYRWYFLLLPSALARLHSPLPEVEPPRLDTLPSLTTRQHLYHWAELRIQEFQWLWSKSFKERLQLKSQDTKDPICGLNHS